MALRRMYDASNPSLIIDVPRWEIVAGYFGGNTPHIWTDKEWDEQTRKSGARWRLPIYTRSHPELHDPEIDAKEAIAWLKAHRVPEGSAVALDFETAVNRHYVLVFNAALAIAGYKVVLYGSTSTLFLNPKPSGGFWPADYTGQPHLVAGSSATQWAGSKSFGGQYDPNLVADSLVLWEVGMSLTQADKEWIDGRMELWATRIVQKIGARDNEAFNSNNPNMDGVLSLGDLMPNQAQPG